MTNRRNVPLQEQMIPLNSIHSLQDKNKDVNSPLLLEFNRKPPEGIVFGEESSLWTYIISGTIKCCFSLEMFLQVMVVMVMANALLYIFLYFVL